MDSAKFYYALMAWYDANRRDLPWRRSVTPYGVWISEIMAQQTQIDRVVTYWDRWMRRFPDLDSLGEASEDEVLNLWEGLGYYSRARNIQKAARKITDDFAGTFPVSFESIRSLPGIGEYTAGAIASIAFGERCPAIDANVLRVFARVLDVPIPVRNKEARSLIDPVVTALAPADRPGDFNQALMELGALICSKRPNCSVCPVAELCLAQERGTVDQRPVLPERKEVIRIDMATGVFVHDDKILIQKRKPDDVWPGLWEFPGGCIEKGERPEEALAREYREEVELDIAVKEKITVVKYSYTRYRVTMHCFLCSPVKEVVPEPVFNEAVTGGFVSPSELEQYAFPSGHRRLMDYMRSDMRFAGWFSD